MNTLEWNFQVTYYRKNSPRLRFIKKTIWKVTEIEIYTEEDIIRSGNAENIFVSAWVEFKVDLSCFSNLVKARLNNKKRENLGTCNNLQELILSQVDKDNDDLSKLHKLAYLDVSEGDIASLNFLKDKPYMKVLNLHYLSKLKDATGLLYVKDTLEELEIDSCKNIEWKGELAQMTNLRKLILGGFKFENIDWITSLSNLEHLSLVDSNVLSGDISPAKDVAYVGIDNKRHYNYRFNDKSMRIVPK